MKILPDRMQKFRVHHENYPSIVCSKRSPDPVATKSLNTCSDYVTNAANADSTPYFVWRQLDTLTQEIFLTLLETYSLTL